MTDPCRCSLRREMPLNFSSITVQPYEKLHIDAFKTRPDRIVSVFELDGS